MSVLPEETFQMLQFMNTMTRLKEPFETREGGRKVKMFSCGPSIYRRPHVGNWRTFIWEDTVQRYLEYLGYDVARSLNFTDVEDKAISEALAEGRTVWDLTGAVAARFYEEAHGLRIKLPNPIPRSSTSVDEAVELLQKLLESGYAYWDKGDVFFDPLKFKGFGKLFRLDMTRWPKEKKLFRRDTYPGRRWNLGDFVLWHGCKEHEPACWETEIGRGRPSWNIQDPAMIVQTLGYKLDIFCGGIDNLYRHHDYNIAVMEAVSGQELARFWLHGEHVLVGGKKMSKSLNNIIYTEDLLNLGCTWEHIRFYMLSTRYRKRIRLSKETFRQVAGKLDALRSMVWDVIEKHGKKSGGDASKEAVKAVGLITSNFENAMNDDLDTGKAIAGLFSDVSRLHALWEAGKVDSSLAEDAAGRLRKIDGVLQFIF